MKSEHSESVPSAAYADRRAICKACWSWRECRPPRNHGRPPSTPKVRQARINTNFAAVQALAQLQLDERESA